METQKVIVETRSIYNKGSSIGIVIPAKIVKRYELKPGESLMFRDDGETITLEKI